MGVMMIADSLFCVASQHGWLGNSCLQKEACLSRFCCGSVSNPDACESRRCCLLTHGRWCVGVLASVDLCELQWPLGIHATLGANAFMEVFSFSDLIVDDFWLELLRRTSVIHYGALALSLATCFERKCFSSFDRG